MNNAYGGLPDTQIEHRNTGSAHLALSAVQVNGQPLIPAVTSEQKLELLEFWRSILKRKWMILAFALTVCLLAAVVANAIKPVYQASATLMIEEGKVKVVSIDEVYTTSQQQRYQTQIQILKSRELSERVARKLKVWDHPLYDPRKAEASWSSRILMLVGIGTAPPKQWSQKQLEDATLRSFAGQFLIESVSGSQMVTVAFESPDPVFAANVVNAVIDDYLEADRQSRFKLSEQVNNFLQESMSSIRDKLILSEQELQRYREQNGLVNLGVSTQAITSKQASDASERMLQARGKRLEVESAYQQASAAKPGNFVQIPAIARDVNVAETIRLIGAARRSILLMQESFTADHYKVKQAQAEIDQLTILLNEQSAAAVANLRSEYESARAIEQTFERVWNEAKGNVQTESRNEFKLNVLERDVIANRQLYELFMKRAKEADVTGDVQPPIARVIDKSIPPSRPIRPSKAGIVVSALAVALIFGAIAAIVLEKLDNTVKGSEDAEARLKQPLLTAVPEVGSGKAMNLGSLFFEEPRSHFAEAIRTARTGILLSSLDTPNKIVLITSSLPGEGKTTIAVNLALAQAQTKKTLLVDCDMRRSQVAKILDVPLGSKGLSNFLSGISPIQECIFSVPQSTLSVLAVGDLPPNPLELIVSKRFRDALQFLSAEYEMIILDSPPIELVSDALVLSTMATGVVFVIKAMSTPAPLARKSIARLQRAGGTLVGVIVNQLNFNDARDYYGEYGASKHGYGGYGDTKETDVAKGAGEVPA